MNAEKLAPIYLVGIALNVAALGYAIWVDELLFVVTFGFVLLYLVIRYRMLSTGAFAGE